MTPLTVRRAVSGDEAIVRSLRLQALSDMPEAFGSTLERERARTTDDWRRWLTYGATFILEAQDGPMGIACGVPRDDDPSAMFVMSVWLHASLRGSGTADALMAAVLSWAEAEGYSEASLHVGKANHPARRLYERHRFRATGEEVVRQRDGLVEIEMRRALGGAADQGGGGA